MRQSIRAFSIGLLTASVVLLVLFLFFEDSSVTEQQYTMDELKNKVEEKGYRIVSEEEYITLSLMEDEQDNDDNSEKTETESDNKENNRSKAEEVDKKEDSEAKESKSYTLTVEPNMMPHIVSDLLEKNEIIENASELDQYLEEHDISNLIQIGEHQLNSDMTIAEIAEEITK